MLQAIFQAIQGIFNFFTSIIDIVISFIDHIVQFVTTIVYYSTYAQGILSIFPALHVITGTLAIALSIGLVMKVINR